MIYEQVCIYSIIKWIKLEQTIKFGDKLFTEKWHMSCIGALGLMLICTDPILTPRLHGTSYFESSKTTFSKHVIINDDHAFLRSLPSVGQTQTSE